MSGEGNGTSDLPFGSPDGDRTDFADAIADFVSFKDRRFRRGLGMDVTDRRARVIVGRKGAGKTLYLRRLQDSAKKDNSLYADDWQAKVFNSDSVLTVSEWYPDQSQAIEKWEAIWRCATLGSLVSHLLFAADLRSADAKARERLRNDFKRLLPVFTQKESIYTQVVDILQRNRSKEELDEFLADRGWSALETLVENVLIAAKPVCFYLDALDEYFEHAPRQWLACQLGLFQMVMMFLKNPRMGGRLHIVIGVRDIVFSSRLSSEHKTKYLLSNNIRTLDWDRDAVVHLLDQKLMALDEEYQMKPEAMNPVERWLGHTEIINGLDEAEPILDYLLRHTRLIPRDIVQIGNVLCAAIDKSADFDQPFLAHDDIRKAVRHAAREFGEESLLMVANQVTADAMPEGAHAEGYSNVYTGEYKDDVPHGKALQEALAEHLGDMLSTLKVVRFSRKALEDFEKRVGRMIGGGENLLNTLWHHGLLGHIDGPVLSGSVTFYDAASPDDAMRLPRGMPGYALHPILIDAIPGLKGTGTPVCQN
jgi:hypothetical protein